MATAQSVIKNFMNVLNNTSTKGTAALDDAVKAVSNFETWAKLKSTIVSDRTAYGSDWEGFLKDCCGIILDNEDTGAISGSDAGGSSIKNAESVVPENGSWSYPSGTSFTKQGLTVKVPEESSLNEKQKFIVGALYSWWIDSALTIISNSYGLSFTDSGATVTEIDVSFYNNSDGKMAYVEYSSDQKSTTALRLKVNMNYYNDIDTSNENGSASGLITYLDRTIAHEMVHAVMAANIDYFSNLPKIFKEGSAELVHGIDDKRTSTIKAVSKTSSALSSGLKSTGVEGYASGYILLRYLAKQAAQGRTLASDDDDSTSSTNTSSTSSNTSSTGSSSSSSKTSTTSSGSSSTSSSSTSSKTSTTSSGSSSAGGSSTSSKTSTTSSGSSSSGGSSSSSKTSTTSSGSSSSGGSSSSSSTNTQDSSATFSVSGNTLVVKGNYGKDVWLDQFENPSATEINASQMTSAGILAGNNNNNLITSGSGGASLWGGNGGNDTLTGGSGQDTFCYTSGNGNDVIKNFNGGTDVLIVSGVAVSSIARDLGSIHLQMSDGGSLNIGLGGDINTAIKFSSELGTSTPAEVKVGNTSGNNNFTYSQNISNYYGGNQKNTLTVSEAAEIWLSSDKFSNINEVNASRSSGQNILAGDENSNTIIGSSGISSLWGGSGNGDDILRGGSGLNTFWYGVNEGNDRIESSKSTDSLNLYNVQLSDIISFGKVGSEFKANFTSGSLTIIGAVPKVNLGDGSSWTYNTKTGNFSQS